MSTIRIDKKHQDLLDKLIAKMVLKGNKITKKKLLGLLIEKAAKSEEMESNKGEIPLEEDVAWKELDNTFSLGIKDLSEKVDFYLYQESDEQKSEEE